MRALGWQVSGTSNWRGNIPSTTVYYPAGFEAAAEALARDLGIAYLRGRDFVTPDLVKTMAAPILEHRLILRPQAAALGRSAGEVLREVLDQVKPPV